MSKHPLAEVFGFSVNNLSPKAERYRRNRLCPFNNKVPSCTKDKANDPLGVCSIFDGDDPVITCPIRFREDWVIAEDASAFFFAAQTRWTSLTEVPLNDKLGRRAGNIDLVLVVYDEQGRVRDFGSLEVQAVYISGNVRQPFEYYMADPPNRADMDWTRRQYSPRPDYLSSSRKRLAPQLIYKGGILKAWGKKQAVVLQRAFFRTLPALQEVEPDEADMVWLLYDLVLDSAEHCYRLTRYQAVFTRFQPALQKITTPEVGSVEEFIERLQGRLDEKLENGYPPDAPTLADMIGF